jgi:hypothetical protein
MSKQPNLPLEHLVYSESALLEVLGISKEVLDTLRREKGFPCVYLDQRHRVYLAKQVLEWLEGRAK